MSRIDTGPFCPRRGTGTEARSEGAGKEQRSGQAGQPGQRWLGAEAGRKEARIGQRVLGDGKEGGWVMWGRTGTSSGTDSGKCWVRVGSRGSHLGYDRSHQPLCPRPSSAGAAGQWRGRDSSHNTAQGNPKRQASSCSPVWRLEGPGRPPLETGRRDLPWPHPLPGKEALTQEHTLCSDSRRQWKLSPQRRGKLSSGQARHDSPPAPDAERGGVGSRGAGRCTWSHLGQV